MNDHLLVPHVERVPLRGTHYVPAAAFDKVAEKLIAADANAYRTSHDIAELRADNNKLAEENRELRIAYDALRRATVARADSVLKVPVPFWKRLLRLR